MKKLTILIFTLLFALSVPLLSMARADEGTGDKAPAMHCGEKHSPCMKHMEHGRVREGKRGEFGHRGGFLKIARLPFFYIEHAKDLKLTDDQVASLKKISFEMKKDMVSKGSDVKLRRLELKEILDKPDYKLEDATAKLKEVEDARLALATAALQHATQARDVLTPDQLKNIKNIKGHCGDDCQDKPCGKEMKRHM
ncbi:MAG: Spy/CpxP family protein refolding chaperone [Nitrospirota bacterium]